MTNEEIRQKVMADVARAHDELRQAMESRPGDVDFQRESVQNARRALDDAHAWLWILSRDRNVARKRLRVVGGGN